MILYNNNIDHSMQSVFQVGNQAARDFWIENYGKDEKEAEWNDFIECLCIEFNNSNIDGSLRDAFHVYRNNGNVQ